MDSKMDTTELAIDVLYCVPSDTSFKKRAPSWVVNLLLRLVSWLDGEWEDQALGYSELEERLELAEEAVHQAADFYSRRGVRDMRESGLTQAAAPGYFERTFYNMARSALGKEIIYE
jgi:hypothetical protein